MHWLPSRLKTVEDVFALLAARGSKPDVLVAPDIHGCYLPLGIEAAPCPTVILHIDSFSAPHERAETSGLFDLSVVFHPSSVDRFSRKAVVFISHAIDTSCHRLRRAGDERSTDVAFVGNTEGSSYGTRAAALRMLKATPHDVAVRQAIGYEEMLALYCNSKIGVNVSRDDYPGDANLRCFEVMGCGALLMTGSPSELEEMGFRDGVDYVGYSTSSDMIDKITHFLAHPDARLAIASRGQSKVLAGHTYDVSARRLLEAIDPDVRARARARAASPPKFSADICARYYIARGYCSKAMALLARAPVQHWASIRRAGTVGRLVKAVCGRLITGQRVY